MKKVSFYLLLIFIISGCNSTKRVAEGELLLTKNTIIVDDKKNPDSNLNDYITQRPNNKPLGLPFSLYIHNLGNKENSKTPKQWGTRNPKTYNFFKNLFSEKQSIGVANTFIGINNWLLSNEAPVIIDKKKTKKTANTLSAYFVTQGYFNNKVSYSIDSLKNKKKAEITYKITKGEPIFIDTITTEIKSSVLDSIYKQSNQNTYLNSKEQYNDKNFRNEANRIIKLFRNSGIYHFTDGYLELEVDTLKSIKKAKVLIKVKKNRVQEINGRDIEKPFKVQRIKKINVVTDYSFIQKNRTYIDSINYQGIDFYAINKLKYNPKYLSQSVFIKPNSVYSDSLRNLTRDHLKSLQNFKSVTIRYDEIPNSDDELEATILLTPTEKFSIGIETELTHSNIRDVGVSGKFSITNRNAFKGSELFKLSFLGSYFNSKNGAGWEFGADASVEVPRFVAPFGLNKLVPKEMSPKTIFSLGTSVQKNIGLDRQTFTLGTDYKWNFNKKKTIQLNLFNVQYIRNLDVNQYYSVYSSEYTQVKNIGDSFFPNDIINGETIINTTANSFVNKWLGNNQFQSNNPTEYQTLANINNRRNIITSNFIIPTIAYTFTYNNQTNFKDNSFSFFKIRIANSGNFVSLLSNNKNSDGVKTLAETPIAQYFKTDIEYKKFWNVKGNSVLGIRTFLGAVIPYGNSEIPFSKSYFAGGSNDIRAWRTYSLGPGSTQQGLEFNTGNFKFITSLEYRFDLFSIVKGALFVDAGNIWNISSSFLDEASQFKGIKSLEQIAIGSGFGTRFDFSFLILRADVGFKTYEPYLTGNKWFKNYNIKNAVLNIGINYPF